MSPVSKEIVLCPGVEKVDHKPGSIEEKSGQLKHLIVIKFFNEPNKELKNDIRSILNRNGLENADVRFDFPDSHSSIDPPI